MSNHQNDDRDRVSRNGGPAATRPAPKKPREGALAELIAEAQAMVTALTGLEKSRGEAIAEGGVYDDSTRLLLDNYSALAERIFARTPQTIAEIRAVLLFCLEDRHYRLMDGDRLATMIGALLRSPALAGGGPLAPAPKIARAADARGRFVAPSPDMAARNYVVCADGQPLTGALNFDEAARFACEALKMRPGAEISIYDMTTAVHYF